MGHLGVGAPLSMACAAAATLLAGCATAPGGEGAMGAAADMGETCAPDGGLAYICGPADAEDIVQVGATRWLLASSISPLDADPFVPGRIYLIDARAKTYEELFPGPDPVFRYDAAMYPGCPGPVNLEAFDTHGLAIRETSPGRYRVYSTSHGERDSIEAFELDATGDTPAIVWVGCVPVSDDVWPNSVAILADGGFVTTKFMDPTDPASREAALTGEVNGAVYEWHPGGELREVAGTGLSGPNGINLSADDRWMFVAAYGGHEVVRFDRQADPITRTSVAVGVTPDNLRWIEGNLLLTVGGDVDPPPPDQCAATPCEPGWSIYLIDASTMEARRIAGANAGVALQNASTAIQIGREIWIGTFGGDRIGVFTLPDTEG